MRPVEALAIGIGLAALVFSTGCHTLLPKDKADNPQPNVISSTDLGAVPNFDVETPTGFVLTKLHGRLDATQTVTVAPGSTIRVFIKDQAGWFQLGVSYSSRFYQSRIDETTVKYQGNCKDLEYCVYQYTEESQSHLLY